MNWADYPLFWGLLAATLGLCGWAIAKAVVRPALLTELPFFVSVMFLYFYGYMAWNAATRLALFLPAWTMELGQFVAVSAFVGLLVGWRLGRVRRPERAHEGAGNYSASRLWAVGTLLILVGALGYREFAGPGGMDYERTTAYWYLIFHLLYPGLALCLVAMAWSPRYRTLAHRLFLTGLVVYSLYPHLVMARRGPVFPAIMVLVLVPPLAKRAVPKRLAIITGFGVAGAAMLVLVAVRPWVYTEGANAWDRWVNAMESVSAEQIFVQRTLRESDNEYVYHCGLTATIVERGAYQYGTGYLTLFTHWIPRQWWAGKPALGQGMFPDAASEIPYVMGWSLSGGASAGGVAEVFNQFGFASPLFWLAFGFAVAILYGRANEGDPRWQLGYVGIICASHWLISQGVAAAFVPACVYVIIPIVVLRFARVGTASAPHR